MQTDRNDIKELRKTYFNLLEKQKFDEKELDYSILDAQSPVLQKLAETSNSLITVFDLFPV